uniref:Uncharacterized protein n=1 Tax=Cacopsylla melanoneura TaxID=428564 RepID=A0A8D8XDC3_9HEMI
MSKLGIMGLMGPIYLLIPFYLSYLLDIIQNLQLLNGVREIILCFYFYFFLSFSLLIKLTYKTIYVTKFCIFFELYQLPIGRYVYLPDLPISTPILYFKKVFTQKVFKVFILAGERKMLPLKLALHSLLNDKIFR